MAVKYTKRSVVIAGNLAVEAAEDLAKWLLKHPTAVVDVSAVGHLHAAVLQVLLALRPSLKGEPGDPWLRAAITRPAE